MGLFPKQLKVFVPFALLLSVVNSTPSSSNVNASNYVFLWDYTLMLNPNLSSIFRNSDFGFVTDAPDDIKFNHSATLNKMGNVRLEWYFDDENITFKLSAPTGGWIGLGIARTRVGNAGADFAVMGHKRNGDSYLEDLHIDSRGNYVLDNQQNVRLEDTWETSDETFAIFTRSFITCDHSDDVDITPDTLRVIWAYGASDIQGFTPTTGELVNEEQGSINIKLLNPSIPPLEMDTGYTDTETLTVTAQNISVEQGEHRNCIAFQFPNATSKAHIIQFEPILTPGNEYNIRQIAVRQCRGPKLGLFSGERSDCNPATEEFVSNCKTIIVQWAMGTSTFTFPEDTGFAIGEMDTYFTMEILYSNPKGSALVDSSGLKIYYTSQSRKHEVGVLTTGSLVYESQIIPPRSPDFLLQGHCTKKCIQTALPQNEEVTIFAALLHAGEKGRGVKVRHFRNGEELTPVADDNRFDFHFQETQFLSRYVQLREGDYMIVECTYDTLDRNEITYVNNSKGGESCLVHLSYYPRFAQLTECETAPIEKAIMETTGAEQPKLMKKSVEEFEWTSQQTRKYNAKMLTTPVYVKCGDSKLEDPQSVPEIKKIYVDQKKCESAEPGKLSQTTIQPIGHNSIQNRTVNDDDAGNGSISLIPLRSGIVYLVITLFAIYHNLVST